MDQAFFGILSAGSQLQVIALLCGAFLFLIIGINELRTGQPNGLLGLAVGGFFLAAHLFVITNLPEVGAWLFSQDQFQFQDWLVRVCGPAIIGAFGLRGLRHLFVSDVRGGLYALFFGGSLYSYLFLLGGSWSLEVRAFLAIVWLGFLATHEFLPRTA